MAHPAAFDFVRRCVQSLPPLHRVVEFGSRQVNGSVIEICRDATTGKPGTQYLGVDMAPGKGVDLVMDAAKFETDQPFDAVICSEVFEHAENWREICAAAYRALRRGGAFIVTCASPLRAPHSAGGSLVLPEGEYYGGVNALELSEALRAAGFDLVTVDLLGPPEDTRAFAMRVR